MKIEAPQPSSPPLRLSDSGHQLLATMSKLVAKEQALAEQGAELEAELPAGDEALPT